jgi:glycosyltransferase involved in cell wall biosynthesis
MKNVLFVSGLAGDTRRYRCLHHQEQLALHNIASTLRTADDLAVYADITMHDLLILHRVPASAQIVDLIELAHLRGLPVVFETDDLIFEPELYGSIAFLDTLTPEAANRFRADLHDQARSFALSDYVLTTTSYLAEAAARHGKTVFIQRNACSAEMLERAQAAYRRRNNESGQSPRGDEVVVGYFSGTGSHNRDFRLATPALLELLRRYPHLWLHVSGHLELDDRFLAFSERIRRAPYVDWRELPNLIAQVDINLAPLELDNPFCQAKSEIKYSEAALVGVPTVASPTEAFRYAITNGENGYLAEGDAAWLEALVRLVEEPAERQRIGEAARRRVYSDYSPLARSQQLVAILHQIEQSYTPAGSAPERLAERLAQMMLRHLERLSAEQARQERQLEQLRQTIATWEAKPETAQQQFWRRSFEQAETAHYEALRSILERLRSN